MPLRFQGVEVFMSRHVVPLERDPHAQGATRRNHARAGLRIGSFEAHAEVDVSTKGLLAIGFLVSAILLSVAPIIVAATRKLPPR